jgi:acetylornithine deacetylase/succinyl-diaminopimelate desuccinylase family protein
MIKEVFNQIDSAAIVEFARELIKVPTESHAKESEKEVEAKIAPLIISKLKSLGMKVEVYDVLPGRPNIIGVLRGEKNKPSLLLEGHTDVVSAGEGWTYEPFEGVVKDGKLYGRGAADMKGGVAAMIMAAEAIVRSNVKLDGDLIIAAVMGEETGLLGAKSLIKRGFHANAAIICEPTCLEVCTAEKGSGRFDIVIRGKAAHASKPHLGVNAIDKMLKVMVELEKYKEKLLERRHPLLGNPTFTYTLIEGGLRRNIVPDYCKLHVDTRLIPGETAQSRWNEVRQILKALKERDPDLNVELKQYDDQIDIIPCEISAEHPIVKVALEAVKKVRGVEPHIKGLTGATDMAVIFGKGKIPTIVLGPGSVEQAHIVDEYVEISQLIDATKIYATIILDLLGESNV